MTTINSQNTDVSSGMEAVLERFRVRLIGEKPGETGTHKVYLGIARWFCAYLAKQGITLEQVNEEIAANFRDILATEKVFKHSERKRGLRDSNTIATYVCGLNCFLRVIGKDFKLKPPRLRPKDVLPLTSEECGKLVEGATNQKDPIQRARDLAIVVIALDEGRRKSEIQNLRLADLNLEGREAILRDTKDGSDYAVSINPNTVGVIKSYIAVRPQPKTPEDAEFVFLNKWAEHIGPNGVSDAIKRAAKNGGITRRVYPHLCRHTKISQFGERASIMTIKGMRWHKNWKSTERYMHPNKERVKQVAAALSMFGNGSNDENAGKNDAIVIVDPSVKIDINGPRQFDTSQDIAEIKRKLVTRLAIGEIDADAFKIAMNAIEHPFLEAFR